MKPSVRHFNHALHDVADSQVKVQEHTADACWMVVRRTNSISITVDEAPTM